MMYLCVCVSRVLCLYFCVHSKAVLVSLTLLNKSKEKRTSC